MNKTFTITPVHDILLRGSTAMPIGLYQLHLATAAQLTTLHYSPGMHKTVLKRLKVLTDHGYVQADATAIKHKDVTGRIYFTTRYYYALGQRGFQFLDHLGLDTPQSARARKDITTDYVHIGHHLELNDIFIAALRLKYTGQDITCSGALTIGAFSATHCWWRIRVSRKGLNPTALSKFVTGAPTASYRCYLNTTAAPNNKRRSSERLASIKRCCTNSLIRHNYRSHRSPYVSPPA